MPEITILQVNDIHGYIAPHQEMIRDAAGNWTFTELGGLARIAGLFDRVRADLPGAVIALDNGDTFHGTHVAGADRGKSIVPLLNALKLDAMTVHWEFAYGPDGVKEIAALLDYPVLAVNCHSQADDSLMFAPYRMIERSGLRIAIIGLACPIVDKTMPPSFSTGIYFTIGDVELRRWIKHVREIEMADLIVVLSHLGFPQDVKLAGEVDGIDALVSGHTHNRMQDATIVNGAIIFQSGCHGSFVGRLDCTVEGGKIVAHRHQLIPVDRTIHESADVSAMVDQLLSSERATMSEVIGKVTEPLHRYAMLSSSMDDVLLEAIASAADRDIAFSNGWRYGAPIPPGPVTVNDLWNIIPTNPPISLVEISGSELRQMLEENLERTFAANPYEQMGGYVKRMRGVKMYFKAENPKGHRIDRLFVLDQPVDDERFYAVAFVTAQGVPQKFGRNRQNLDIHAIDALKALFARKSPVTPSSSGTVLAI